MNIANNRQTDDQITTTTGDVVDLSPEFLREQIENAGKLNDAVILGKESPEWQALEQRPMTFSRATDSRSKKWKSNTKTLGEWLDRPHAAGDRTGLTVFEHSATKDGQCVTTGSIKGKQRLANAMDDMDALWLDMDNGTPVLDAVQSLLSAGLAGFVYTTHSHLKTEMSFRRDAVLKAIELDRDPTDDELRNYIQTQTNQGYTDAVVDGLAITDADCLTPDGTMIIAETVPIPKFRVCLFFDDTVTRHMRGDTDLQRKENWKASVLTLAEQLGLKIDPAARDVSRLFYTPRVRHGSACEMYLVRGRGLKWDEIFTVATTSKGKDSTATTPDGVSLKTFAAQNKDTFFNIVDLFETYAQDHLRGTDGLDKAYVECPFGDNHSSGAGDGVTSTYIANSDLGFNWKWHCSHSCSAAYDRLDYLAAAMDAGWFTWEQVTEYMQAPDGEDIVPAGGGAHGTASAVSDQSGLTFTPDIFAPLYDELLVDQDGYVLQPDKAARLYKLNDINVGTSDEDKQKAYKAMVGLIRDQIRESMRGRFSYVVFNGDAKAAVRTAPGVEVLFYGEGSLDRLFRNREVSYIAKDGKGKDAVKNLKPAQLFMYDRERITFGKTAFEPDPLESEKAEVEGAFNLWTGYAVQPEAGEWDLLKDHLRDVVCGGNIDLFNWHMTFVASLFARPGVKIQSSIAVKGEQGTGKSKFWDWVRTAMGCAAMKVSQGKHLVGQFNGHLDCKLLIVVEEGFWAGDKAAGGVIKDLISAEELTIEAKFEKAQTRKNRIAVVFISNNEWVIPTDGSDARRFLVLEASDTQKGNPTYFAAIDRQMQNGGVAAMVQELTNWEPEEVGLTWDSLRKPPTTDSLREQAGMGLAGPLEELVKVIEEATLEGRTSSMDPFYYSLNDNEPTRVVRTHLTAVLGNVKGRGNVTTEANAAIKLLLGADADKGNKEAVTYWSAERDGKRDEITLDDRVRYVEFPPRRDLVDALAAYGREVKLDVDGGDGGDGAA